MTVAAAQLAPDLPHGLTASLEGVAYEIRLLQAHVLRMQDLCRAPDMGSALDAVVIRELQGLDLVAQRLDALSGFVLAVTDTLPFDPAMDLSDALAALSLQDMAERLSAQAAGLELPETSGPPAGDFDLF